MDSHERWVGLQYFLREKDPIAYALFNFSMARAELCVDSMKRNSTRWLGLIFHYPLIWCPARVYRITLQWDEFNEFAQWTQVDWTLGFYTSEVFGHPPYNWSDIRAGIPERE